MFNEYLETCFIELDRNQLGLGKNVISCVLYKPPNTDMEIFNEQLNQIMYAIKQERKYAYIMGDYNINLLNHDTHRLTGEFLNMIYSNGFIPLITRLTRSVGNTNALIDNILTNNIDELKNVMQGIFATDVSDHYPIFYINWRLSSKTVAKFITCRIMNRRSYDRFATLIAAFDWQGVYNKVDTNEAFFVHS